jgi:hypothetical protein
MEQVVIGPAKQCYKMAVQREKPLQYQGFRRLLQPFSEWFTERELIWGVVHGTRCFALRKHDATEIDISFPHAIRLITSTRAVDILPQSLRDFRNAARSAVRSQIFTFRDEVLLQPQSCPVTGEQLSRSNAAVDHVSPNTFDTLIFTFCTEHSINPLGVQVGSEGGVLAVFEDKDLLQLWKSFHQDRATLRLVSGIVNLKLPKPRVAWAELWS